MNPELAEILDRALRYSIWVFLISYLIILLAARARVRKKKQRVGDLYEQMAEPQEDRKPSRSFHLSDWPIALNSLVLAFICSLFFFVLYTLVPFPSVDNLVTSTSWQVVPLRVTQIKYDRYYEGFSASGEVWNQTDEPLSDVRLIVEVIGADEELLDQFETALKPMPVPPGEASRFEFSYEKNSPFIEGYRLRFESAEGSRIPHVTGFDTR